MANWTDIDLICVDGMGVTTVMKLLAEIGPDLRCFANVMRLCSWLGLCPGTKVCGGKVPSANTKRSANRAAKSSTRRDEPVAQRLSLGCVLSQVVRTNG